MSTHESPRLQVERIEPLLSINEAAAFLGVSRSSIYALLDRGDLPHVRVGERTRFVPAEINRYLERHREGAEAP